MFPDETVRKLKNVLAHVLSLLDHEFVSLLTLKKFTNANHHYISMIVVNYTHSPTLFQ